MPLESTLRILFSISLLGLISLSQECKASQAANLPDTTKGVNKILFSPTLNITFPDGQIQQQIVCEGDCDDDVYQFIDCEGDFRANRYTCELVEPIVNYELANLPELFCAGDMPIDTNSCYLIISLVRTDLFWVFDSRITIENPIAPGNEMSQVVCYGSYCKKIDLSVVECEGVFAKNAYNCSIVELPENFELIQFAITCKEINVKTNENCFVTIKVYEKATELDPNMERIKKLIYALVGLLIGLLIGFLFGHYIK